MSELWSHPLPIALLSLLVLGWFVGRPRRGVQAHGWTLLRCLVPSWQFFDRVEHVPTLRSRVAANGADWSEWRAALTAPARTLSSLWSNAAGNLHLACRSLVEHLVAELEQAAE